MIPYQPEALQGLVAYYLQAIWPAQLVALLLTAVALGLVWRAGPARGVRGRVLAALLAMAWLWCGLVYQAQYYATLNWAGLLIYAPVFILQALLLLWVGTVCGGFAGSGPVGPRGAVVCPALLFGASLLHPVLAVWKDVSWHAVGPPGLLPHPTAVATIGLVLMTGATPRARWTVLVIPVLWCLWAVIWAGLLESVRLGGLPAMALLGVAILAVGAAQRR